MSNTERTPKELREAIQYLVEGAEIIGRDKYDFDGLALDSARVVSTIMYCLRQSRDNSE